MGQDWLTRRHCGTAVPLSDSHRPFYRRSLAPMSIMEDCGTLSHTNSQPNARYQRAPPINAVRFPAATERPKRRGLPQTTRLSISNRPNASMFPFFSSCRGSPSYHFSLPAPGVLTLFVGCLYISHPTQTASGLPFYSGRCLHPLVANAILPLACY